MSEATPITIPLINPNEPEALLADLHAQEGQQITAGSELCTLETTKSTQVVLAETDGYLVGLQFQAGDTVRAGAVLGYLADAPDWIPDPAVSEAARETSADPMPPDLRITQPALALARDHNLDPDRLPRGKLVTETVVRSLLFGSLVDSPEGQAARPFNADAILVYGGGGHGKAVIDLLRTLGSYHLVGIVDDGFSVGEEIMGFPVLGGAEALAGINQAGTHLAVNAVGGIGNVLIRLEAFNRLAAEGFACPAIIHPSAWIEPSAHVSAGVQVFPQAYVGSEATLGYGTIINTGAIVSHDCVLADMVNISPGAILAGGVRVNERALVGMGVTINLGVNIGAGARIGNGATIKQDVPSGGVVRAGSVWPEP